jgi:hypothetical protein
MYDNTWLVRESIVKVNEKDRRLQVKLGEICFPRAGNSRRDGRVHHDGPTRTHAPGQNRDNCPGIEFRDGLLCTKEGESSEADVRVHRLDDAATALPSVPVVTTTASSSSSPARKRRKEDAHAKEH